MNETIEAAKGVLDTLLKMPTILLFALALNVIGWGLKRMAFIPNKVIPLVILVLSGVGIPWLIGRTPPGDMSPYLSNPDLADLVRRVCIGLVIGLVAWGSHKLLLGKLEKCLPGLAGNGDTATIRKSDVAPPSEKSEPPKA